MTPRQVAIPAGSRIHSSRPDLSIRVYERIGDVDPAQWDSLLTAEDLQVSHRFVRICEDSAVENAVYRHVMIERAGRLAAVATLCRIEVSLDLLSSGGTRSAIRWARRWRSSFLRVPMVLCGLPVSFGGSCVRLRRGEDPAAIVNALAALAESTARELGAQLVCFKEFASDQSPDFDPLVRRGYARSPSLPFCTLSIPWRSFGQYLASARAGYRRQVVASMRAARAAGLTVRLLDDFGPECVRIFRLYEQVMDHAEFQLERLNLGFFERLNAYLGPQSRAMLVERDRELAAAAVLLDTPGDLTFLLAGIDYRSNRECHAYPFLVTQIVAEAIRRGARTLHLGQTSYALKGRLGALSEPRWFYLRHRASLRNALLRAASGMLFPTAKVPARRVFRAGCEPTGRATAAAPVSSEAGP